ncbi:hypothetical protein KC717_06465 [Candidatus Dojkabacteria bacterium]|uniref:Uncharacterized protein n=1 Tax=Candidatus Dojkabacteria bacterium TaxID=2099670 RepID=A0A955RKV2_9BACT|nr:hypothetical protein [Candidatus Dojkabacteria bacterium]
MPLPDGYPWREPTGKSKSENPQEPKSSLRDRIGSNIIPNRLKDLIPTGTAAGVIEAVSHLRPDVGNTVSEILENSSKVAALESTGSATESEIKALKLKNALKTVTQTVARVATLGMYDAIPGMVTLLKENLIENPDQSRKTRIAKTIGYGGITTAATLTLSQIAWNAGMFAALPSFWPVAALVAGRQLLNYGIHKAGEHGWFGEHVKKIARPMRNVTSGLLVLGSLGKALPGPGFAGPAIKPIVPQLDIATTNIIGSEPQIFAEQLYNRGGQSLIDAWNAIVP